jgi:amino acid transporter
MSTGQPQSQVSGSNPGVETVPRAFNWKSAFSIAFAFISPIVALYGIFFLVFLAAGPASWWAFATVMVAQVLVAAVLGLLASKWPFAGGIYAWARRLGGPTYGWFAGWAYMWTLMIAIGSAAYIATLFIPVVIGVEPFDPVTQVLVALGFVLVGTLLNLLGQKTLKAVGIIAVIIELVGSLGLGIWLLLFHQQQPISVIFESFGSGYGEGPWIWSGFAAAVAFVGWAFVGFESAGDIAEEVENPQKSVPKAMIASILVVGSVVLFSALAVILSIPDIEAVIAGESADPVADTIIYHLGEGVVRPLFAMFVLAFLATFVTAQAAASRVIWGFARDTMLPGSAGLSKLSRKNKIPANAVAATGVVAGLVVVSSLWGVGYGTLVLFAIAGFYIAFAFPIFGLLRAQLNKTWVGGVFRMGKWEFPLTLIAAIWVLFEMVNIAWPRDTSAPWYIQWGVVLITVIIGAIGGIIYQSRKSQIISSHEHGSID